MQRPAGSDAATTLPSGTVTFLFTDIEGSTRLVERLGTAVYSTSLERHQSIVREVLAQTAGIEIKTEGDSFFVVFRSAASAVAAAAAIQRNLGAATWPQDGAIRVRMGLHTGEGVIAPDADYVGLDVHRAARIAAAGHGGQVLLSVTTQALVAGSLPPGVASRDLGEHRLKDLSRPERIHQLLIDGLGDQFPPLRTLDALPNNLPVLLTSFVGRERVLAEAGRLLQGTRLLTLTGPGGTGKTRLSLQLAADAADRFPDGVFFVALEPITDPALVPPTVAMAVRVQDTGGASVEERLYDYLRDRQVLLLLDNMEQVTGAAPFVADLLRRAPRVSCIVTTRAVLHVYGEQEYPVPTLGLPEPEPAVPPALEDLARIEAVALFMQRARTARPDFELTEANARDVARLVTALDGLPLALELAAARVKLLAPDGMLARLQGRLDLLGGGARDLPARQQTLHNAIAWSYDLLDPAAQGLFGCIAVFVGGFELEAAEAVCAGPAGGDGPAGVFDGLANLLDQSLLRQSPDPGRPRFLMLETIRSFALERLAEDPSAPELRRRHAEYFAAFAETAMPHLTASDRAAWLDRVEADHDNLRGAITFAIELGDAHLGMRLVYALWRFWQSRAHLQEGAERVAAVLAIPTDETHTELRARALEAGGGLAYWRGTQDEGREYYDGALAIARELGDESLIADALYNGSMVRTVLASNPTVVITEGKAMLEEAIALYRRVGDEAGAARALWGLGTVQYFEQDWQVALATFQAAEAVLSRTDDAFMQGWVLHMLGSTEVRLGLLESADEHIGGALTSMRAAGETTGIVMVLADFADLAAERGEIPRSLRLMGAGRALEDVTGARLATVTEELMRRDRYRDALTAPEADRLLAEGRSMSLDEAIAYAMDVPATKADTGAT